MNINFSPINFHYKTTQTNLKKQNVTSLNLRSLSHDTISFGAMRKKEFDGIDLAVIQKFKAPIEKFNSNEDLQNWAGKKAKEIVDKDFGGRSKETKIQRKAMIKEWADYVLDENDAYKKTTAFLILSAITKDLDLDNDNIPPVLNKRVLADCIAEIDKNTKIDSKYQFDLNKMYRNKLRIFYADDTETNTGETSTKWVVIPSYKHDSKNFEANVEKLKALSHKTWCTKSFNAKPYLEDEDFHVYLENGKPKLGVRFIGDEIEEIQGEKNDGKIPVDYFDILQKHIFENNLRLLENAQNEMETARKTKKEIDKIKSDLAEAIKNNDIKAIYGYFEIDTEEDKDGYLTISKYKQPSENYTFKDLGIDENVLLKKVKIIKKTADFSYSKVTNLENLEIIGGHAYFNNSQVTNLENLKTIGGDAYFNNSQVTDLKNLKTISGSASFSNSQIINLPSLETIGEHAYFNNSQVTNLENLKTIGGEADFKWSQVTNLRNLKAIGGDVNFKQSQVINLENLKAIGGDADFYNSKVTNLENLKTIGGDADFRWSQVDSLSNLKIIDGSAYFSYSKVTNLGNLENIGGDADFKDSQVTNLENLKTIGGSASFSNSQVTDLRNLKTIGDDACFSNSQVANLRNLETIGRRANFNWSRVVDLPKLKTIGWCADFSNSQVTNLPSLETIDGDAYFTNSRLENLPSLKSIKGIVYIDNSLLTAEDFKC